MAGKAKFELTRKTPKGKGIEKLAKIEGQSGVKVGVLKGTGAHTGSRDSDAPLVSEIAWWHEFGTWNIPPRPFLRPTMRKNRLSYFKEMQNLLKEILLGNINTSRALKAVGQQVERDIKDMITDIRTPPLAERTLAMRKTSSDNPLVDTGEMRRSIASALMRKART